MTSPVDAAGPADRKVVLGRLVSAWGVRGWLKVRSFTDPPAAILDYPVWQVAGPGAQWQTVRLVAGRQQGRDIVVQLAGVVDRDAALAWCQRDVAVARSELPAPAAGEYYLDDLLGMRVVTLEGIELGVASHFVELPANSVLVVKGQREHWLPVVPKHVKKVDLETRTVTVDWAIDDEDEQDPTMSGRVDAAPSR
jgi:16S rRNA processing protein RimM